MGEPSENQGVTASSRQMEQMLEAGEAETAIVKDMSRLGRNCLQVWMYRDIVFVENDVRLMSRMAARTMTQRASAPCLNRQKQRGMFPCAALMR